MPFCVRDWPGLWAAPPSEIPESGGCRSVYQCRVSPKVSDSPRT